MSESVKILIEADDQASKKMAAAAQNVENSIKTIKSTGDQAKKSTEFLGAIASTLGGSELASYAGQLAGVTDKVAQFSEVQKVGGAGAIAFKAGLMGVVGVLSFNIGKALGDVLWNTKEWTDALAKAAIESAKIDASLAKVKDYKFALQKEEISLIRDPDQQLNETKKLLTDIENEIKAKSDSLKATLAKEAKQLSVDQDFGDDALGFNSERKAQVAAQVEAANKMLDALRAQRDELRNATSEERKRLDALKEQNALQAKSDDYLKGLRDELQLVKDIQAQRGAGAIENAATKNTAGVDDAIEAMKILNQIEQIKSNNAKRDASDEYLQGLRAEVIVLKAKKEELSGIEAAKKTFGDSAFNEANALLKERDALIAKREIEKQAEAEKKAASERIAALKQTELDKLEQERIELTKGKEAAQAFALEKQGLSKADAADIARQRAQVDAAKEPKKEVQATQLQAFESRLLTRGPSQQDATKAVATNTAQAVQELKAMNARLEKERKQDRALMLKVIRS